MTKKTLQPSKHGGSRPGAGRKKQNPLGEATKPIRVPLSFIPAIQDLLEARKQALADTKILLAKPAEDPTKLPIPLASAQVSAGFPSPADDYIEGQLDLNDLMVLHPAATFYVRVTGESMKNAGIFPGDILVVDKSKDAKHNDIVIAIVHNELTVKRLRKQGNKVALVPENPDFPIIHCNQHMDLSIWGVVTGVVRKF